MHVQVVFFGFLIGNPVWGMLADKFGRKKVNKCKKGIIVRMYVCTYVRMYIPYSGVFSRGNIFTNSYCYHFSR